MESTQNQLGGCRLDATAAGKGTDSSSSSSPSVGWEEEYIELGPKPFFPCVDEEEAGSVVVVDVEDEDDEPDEAGAENQSKIAFFIHLYIFAASCLVSTILLVVEVLLLWIKSAIILAASCGDPAAHLDANCSLMLRSVNNFSGAGTVSLMNISSE